MAVDPALLAKYPWLAQTMQAGPRRSSGSCRRSSNDGGGPAVTCGNDEEHELDNEGFEQVFQELYKKREERLLEAPKPTEDFRCTILGGAWTKRHEGVAFDALAAKACTKDSQMWCRQYGLQTTARFAVSLFGESLARIFASARAARVQHYYDIYVNSGNEAYKVTAEDLASHEEPPDFVSAAADLQGQALQRAQQIRAIKPSS